MDAGEAFGHQGGDDGAGGKPLAGIGLVPEGQLVAGGLEGDGVDARDFALADGGYFGRDAETAFDQGAEGLGGAARGIQLMDVVYFFDGRRVAGALEELRGPDDGRLKRVDAEGEVGGIDERGAGIFEGLPDVGLDTRRRRRNRRALLP